MVLYVVCAVAGVPKLLVVLVDPLDLGAAVLDVRVLLPGAEGEGLLHLFNELLEGFIAHCATSEDVTNM